MKVTEVLSTAILILLAGAIAPAGAQEKREPEKQPEQKQQQAKPAPQQAKPQAQRAQAPQPAKPAPQQAKPAQQQAKPQEPQRAQAQQPAKPAPQQAKPQQPQRTQAQQPARPAPQQAKPQEPQRAQTPQRAGSAQTAAGRPNNGGRIPDDRFRASFGSGHTFHVNRAEFAGGPGRFQYGGFWFAMVNPWPAAWLYTDAVYVDYINGGYFLCDPVHPGVLLSINVG
jgi:outer membrane biosynthesis protein TonB